MRIGEPGWGPVVDAVTVVEHSSREPWPEGFKVPGPASAFVKRVQAAGWETRTQYSRAQVPCKRKIMGHFEDVVERRHIVAVRAWHVERELIAVVVWEAVATNGRLSWSADMCKLWQDGQFPKQVVGPIGDNGRRRGAVAYLIESVLIGTGSIEA